MQARQDLNMLLETKQEYTEELVRALGPYIKSHYLEVYDRVKTKNKVWKTYLF